MPKVKVWNIFELPLHADVSGCSNPYTEVTLRALVTGPQGEKHIEGFYDGGDCFILRYMPSKKGMYHLVTRSNISSLNNIEADFEAVEPSPDNHGPVVADGMHFRYADGTRFFVMGTTAYVWHHRPEDVRAKTLRSFSDYGFNKIRMLFFPKHYTGNFGRIDVSYEPPCYPFEGEPCNFDFRRPNPAYFREFEDRLRELEQRDIIADVILFHPYDFGHWDLDAGMDEDDALFYLKYIIARISSFRNVWWSLANEYDIKMLPDKRSMVVDFDRRNWDVIGEFVRARDPYHHPISCHNIAFGRIYPDRPWLTHVSYQHPDTYTLMLELKKAYGKPVINDEYQYEGNLPDEWGNSSGEVELERHWRSVMAGGYATHGEAFIKDNNRDIFWAYGGDMTGESARRLKFMKELIAKCPFEQMERDPVNSDSQHYYTLKKGTDFYLVFMRDDMPGKSLWVGDWSSLDRKTVRYKATVYDVWNCTLVKEEILPPSCRLPITKWTAAILEKTD